MTEQEATVQRKKIADALASALERRHEVLDTVVASEDYDAAIEALAALLDTSEDAAEAVLKLSFDRLTRVSRRRIAAELDNLNSQVPELAPADQAPGPARRLMLRPFSRDEDHDIFAARTRDMRSA